MYVLVIQISVYSQRFWDFCICGRKVKKKKVKVLAALSCLTFCHTMVCSLPGSSVHGIFQAKVLEWVAISFSRGSSWPRDQTQVPCIAGRFFTVWVTREPICGGRGQGKKKGGNPFGLSILDTDFCVYVSHYILIHPCSFSFFWILCVWILSLSMFCKLICLFLFKFCLVFTSYAVFSLCLPDLI